MGDPRPHGAGRVKATNPPSHSPSTANTPVRDQRERACRAALMSSPLDAAHALEHHNTEWEKTRRIHGTLPSCIMSDTYFYSSCIRFVFCRAPQYTELCLAASCTITYIIHNINTCFSFRRFRLIHFFIYISIYKFNFIFYYYLFLYARTALLRGVKLFGGLPQKSSPRSAIEELQLNFGGSTSHPRRK